MKTETQILIDLIKQNKTLNEISSTLGLSNKQIFTKLSMLRSCGYLFDKKYYYNGELKYLLHNPFETTNNNTINVITSKDTKKIRVMLTSDTHLGNVHDKVACIHSMIEYCINNDIHIVLNLGDFFNGIYPNNNRFSTAEEQINYALKNYPYDKNILNFTLLGNHDATFWIKNGIDIKTILENRRHDIIPVGYGYGEINIGGCQFKMQHPLREEQKLPVPQDPSNKIILKGHSHKFKVNSGYNNLTVVLPPLSQVQAHGTQYIIPSMIDMELGINNNQICNQYLQQFIFINNKPIRINEIQYHVPISIQNPQYEEENLSSQIQQTIIEAAHEVNLHQTNQYQGMSQIDKFNARFGENNPKVLKK